MDAAKSFSSQAETVAPAAGGWSQPAFTVADRGAETGFPAEASGRGGAVHSSDDNRISQPLLVGALLLFDTFNFLASGLVAYFQASSAALQDRDLLAGSLAIVTLAGLAILQGRWSYTIRAIGDFARQCVSLAIAFGGALALWISGCVMLGLGDAQLLRDWSLLWICAGWTMGCGARAAFAWALKIWTREGLLARRTVIVGGGAHALDTIRRLEESGKGALHILGVFDDRDRARLAAGISRYRLLGTFDDLESFCREQKVDLLIVAIPISAEARILQILRSLWVLPVDVRISALGSRFKFRDRAYHYIGDVPFLPIFDKPMSDWGRAIKGMFDRVVAAALLVLLAPALALIALGVKLSSAGPILFCQTRYGFNNEPIRVYKFRSMYADLCDPAANRLVTRNDPRVTPFGAFLRRTSLDELPQIFNVLRGELSLVGPRPHAIKGKAAGMLYEQVVDGYFSRHRVKPGITGWAQISGWRGETDTVEKIEQRVEHDLYYIDNWSVWLDIKILAYTPISVLSAKNAF